MKAGSKALSPLRSQDIRIKLFFLVFLSFLPVGAPLPSQLFTFFASGFFFFFATASEDRKPRKTLIFFGAGLLPAVVALVSIPPNGGNLLSSITDAIPYSLWIFITLSGFYLILGTSRTPEIAAGICGLLFFLPLRLKNKLFRRYLSLSRELRLFSLYFQETRSSRPLFLFKRWLSFRETYFDSRRNLTENLGFEDVIKFHKSPFRETPLRRGILPPSLFLGVLVIARICFSFIAI